VRRRRLLWALGGLAVAGLWTGTAALLLSRAAADVRAGTAAISRARAGTELTDLTTGEPIADVRQARASFERAHRRVTSPALLPIRLVPVIGRQLESVAALSGAATDVSDAVLDAMVEGQRLLNPAPASHPARVQLVRALGALAGDTDRRLDKVDLGPDKGLFGKLARSRQKLVTELSELQDQLGRGSAGAAAAAEMLTGPKRYLVFAANNAEMRAGSGMFLSVGELEVDGNGLRLGEMRSVVDVAVPKGAVPIDGDLAGRWGWLAPNVEWRNLMTSPRFDEAAPLAARMWVAAGNRPVDGVLALDPVALQGLLEATGSVAVDGRTISAGNVVDELLHGQYLRFSGKERADRREQLGRIARAAFEALDGGRWTVEGLAKGLAAAVNGRHLMVWSASPVQQAGWHALEVDGALEPGSLLVSVVNRGGNKLDQFLDVGADLSFAPSGPDTEVTVRLTLHNGTPAGEPPYVAGDDPASGVPPGAYLGIVTVNVPGHAGSPRIDGVDRLAVAGPDGPTRVVGVQVRVDRGQTSTVTVRFTLPGDRGTIRVEPSARVPGIAWTGPGGSWTDGSAHEVAFLAG
jgi:hypothetical protein